LESFGFSVQVTKEKALVIENLLALSAPRVVVKRNLEYLRQGLVTKPEEILIVSRKGTPRNNDAIEESLSAQIPEAKLINPGQLSVEEQIKLFSKAKVVIGLHGGALTNCVWMDASSKVIEVFNHAYRTSDYERLCIELGIKYQSVEIGTMNAHQVVLVVERLIHEL
jgi:capsular polysaccharide biosynthesis protein